MDRKLFLRTDTSHLVFAWLLDEAAVQLARGEALIALGHCLEAAHRHPDCALPRVRMAQCLLALGQTQPALAAYRSARRLRGFEPVAALEAHGAAPAQPA